MRFFTSFLCVNTTLWIHHMDANKTHGEKGRLELHKTVEQILEVTPHKTVIVQSVTSNIKNCSSKINKICRTLLEKQGQIRKLRSSIDPYIWTFPALVN